LADNGGWGFNGKKVKTLEVGDERRRLDVGDKRLKTNEGTCILAN
jgi:hypothetical protein